MTPMEAMERILDGRGMGIGSECFCGYPGPHKKCFNCHVKDVIAAVISEERENCAKVADKYGAQAGNDATGGMAHVIAQQIRVFDRR